MRNVEDTFRKEGAGAAMQALGAAFASSGDVTAETEGRMPGGGEAPQGQPDPEPLAMMARLQRNMEFFVGYEVPPFATYVPDFAALETSTVRVVPAVGEASAGEPPHRCALAVAERLGTRAEVFPGDHGGFGSQAEAFADRLHEVLAR